MFKLPRVYIKDYNRLITSVQSSGKIIWQQSPVKPCKGWSVTQTTGGIGKIFRETRAPTPTGSPCWKITTSQVNNGYCEPFFHFYLPKNKRLGLEFLFTAPYFANIKEVRFGIEGYNGANRLLTGIMYDTSSHVWSVLDDTNNWQNFLTYDLKVFAFPQLVWHHIKVRYDFETGKYIDFMVDDTIKNLSDIKIYKPSTITHKRCYCWIALYDKSTAGYGCIYVDDVVVTEEEE